VAVYGLQLASSKHAGGACYLFAATHGRGIWRLQLG